MTVVRMVAVALAASAAVAVTAPAASADCTSDYASRFLVADDEGPGYVTVSGLVVSVHGDRVVADAGREYSALLGYIDCVD